MVELGRGVRRLSRRSRASVVCRPTMSCRCGSEHLRPGCGRCIGPFVRGVMNMAISSEIICTFFTHVWKTRNEQRPEGDRFRAGPRTKLRTTGRRAAKHCQRRAPSHVTQRATRDGTRGLTLLKSNMSTPAPASHQSHYLWPDSP